MCQNFLLVFNIRIVLSHISVCSLQSIAINRRLSRLQKEIIDKNEEISRLQSEIISEADETCALKSQIDDLHKKIKEYERKQGEMNQRLSDYQLLEKASNETEAEMAVLRKQLKKLQNDYEISSQKYCDLNIEHEALKAQQDKDRRQVILSKLIQCNFDLSLSTVFEYLDTTTPIRFEWSSCSFPAWNGRISTATRLCTYRKRPVETCFRREKAMDWSSRRKES